MTSTADEEVLATIHARIDGHIIHVPLGTTILQAARSLGIDIPTLCHHETLRPVGACRLCVVEVEGRRDLVASCSTALQDHEIIWTESEKAIAARRTILDLLLADHPLDCMTCEQAGACAFQDLCYRYGVKVSSFAAEKQALPIESENPMIERDMNKCILCGKCVRVCHEVQVTDAIGVTRRGDDSLVAGPSNRPLDISFCRFCGQCVDICPSGAIINKQLKGTRTWDRTKVRTTCPFCGVGCSFDLNVVDGRVVGVTAAYDAPVNQGSLCVKGRFHTDFITSPDRVRTPLIKRDGVFHEASWDEALTLVAERLLAVKEAHSAMAIGVLGSARCTNEENYLLQRLTRAGLNTNSIDHCART
jgi:predicted molibdopterin-dependent oxidoreductase YjgC